MVQDGPRDIQPSLLSTAGPAGRLALLCMPPHGEGRPDCTRRSTSTPQLSWGLGELRVSIFSPSWRWTIRPGRLSSSRVPSKSTSRPIACWEDMGSLLLWRIVDSVGRLQHRYCTIAPFCPSFGRQKPGAPAWVASECEAVLPSSMVPSPDQAGCLRIP